jgi:hypothetical protein
MVGLSLFNLVMLLLCAAALVSPIPPQLYGFLRGLHKTIGISTPSDQQLRWVLVVWLLAMLVIVDGLALLMAYIL